MLMLKKISKRSFCSLFAGVLVTTNLLYAEENEGNHGLRDKKLNLNYELKVGITPYETYGGTSYSESFNRGLDFGMEVYRPFEKYSLGFGGEVKRKLRKEFVQGDGDRLYVYYLLGKRKIGKTYSLVMRLGRTSQKEFDSEFYGAIGIEKRIKKVGIQLLGETTKLANSRGGKQYNSVGLKVGYVFGKDYEPELIPPTLESEEIKASVIPKLVIEGDEITGGYTAYKTDVPEVYDETIETMTTQLNDYDKEGALEMKAYSDNTGTKKVNVELANERLDKVELKFKEKGLTEKVRFERINPEETIKNEYKVENDTPENRKTNRRVEVTFKEDEKK